MASRLRPLEIAVGSPIGDATPRPVLPEIPSGLTPRKALETAILAGLQKPPCLVSSSGGRDSSAVLAVAVHLARREGLPLPVPATIRFPGITATDESLWQERVVRHLGISDWERLDFEDELDLVGPIARGVLRRHGFLWPPNCHFFVPLLEAAGEGTLLTGIDGDGLFGTWRWARPVAVLTGKVRPQLDDLRPVGLALSPSLVRRVVGRRGIRAPDWLQPSARQQVEASWAEELTSEPRWWRNWVRWWFARRYVSVAMENFARLASHHPAQLLHPLLDPGFLAALADSGGRSGFGGRGDLMRSVFGDLLPLDVLVRTSKSNFDRAFWHRHVQAFVNRWDGTGVDPRVVDPEMVRAAWKDQPDFRLSSLLQVAWLASQGRSLNG